MCTQLHAIKKNQSTHIYIYIYICNHILLDCFVDYDHIK